MKIKENVLLFVLAGFVFFTAYLLLAGFPLQDEIQFLPAWTIDIQEKLTLLMHDNKDQEKSSYSSISDKALPFKLGQFLGCISPEGDIPFMLSFPEKASISQSYWTSYSSNASLTPVYSSRTGDSFVIKESGFPHLVQDDIYVFFPGGNAFGKYSSEGQKLWTAEHWSPITSFSSSDAGTACGYADGDIRFFNNDGDLVFSMYPGGSSYEVVLGIGIAGNGSYIAAVCGLEKQRFILIQLNGKNSKIVYHTYLESEKTEQTLVQFNNEDTRVYFNYEGGIGVVDCRKSTMFKIPIKGRVCSIKELEDQNLSFVLCQDGQNWTVLALEAFTNLIGSFSFTAEDAFMSVLNNDLYIGRDTQISKMEIVKK